MANKPSENMTENELRYGLAAQDERIKNLTTALQNAKTCIEAQMPTEVTAQALAIVNGVLESEDYVP